MRAPSTWQETPLKMAPIKGERYTPTRKKEIPTRFVHHPQEGFFTDMKGLVIDGLLQCY